ncbi:hypothetical protein ABIF70_001390 [Bradyrhizobium japonicum]
MRKASINERNALFGALKQAAPGGVLLYPGHRFETAARANSRPRDWPALNPAMLSTAEAFA